MASLMETLIETLNKEVVEFKQLLELSLQKTPIIVEGNLQELTRITDEEQYVVSRVNKLDKERAENMADIANVLNKDVQTLTLKQLIGMLDNRPAEQRELAEVHDKLQDLTKQLQRANLQNSELIKNALEMVQFDMNLIQASRTAPQTANYNKGAYNAGVNLGAGFPGGFDAKQ